MTVCYKLNFLSLFSDQKYHPLGRFRWNLHFDKSYLELYESVTEKEDSAVSGVTSGSKPELPGTASVFRSANNLLLEYVDSQRHQESTQQDPQIFHFDHVAILTTLPLVNGDDTAENTNLFVDLEALLSEDGFDDENFLNYLESCADADGGGKLVAEIW